ncbi:MAG: phosphotransferase family protein [Alphaproteobacteria bacterium]|nr:phosphotransferase family protein [Alphaproteobacteria bacterium]
MSDPALQIRPAVTEAEVEAALTRLATGRLAGDAIVGLTRLTAGASQEIWRFSVRSQGVETPLILRRAPGGERVSDTAIGPETEAALIRAAGVAGVPTPDIVHVLHPADGLGRGYVMSFVDGETLGGRIARGEAFAAARQVLAGQCGAAMAAIHRIDPAAFPGLKRVTPLEFVTQYLEAYRASAWPRPVFDLAFRWLLDRCPPPPERPALVHGDFRNGNIMVGPEGLRAVLDWELAHVADPMEDLGWICVNSWRFGVAERPVGGFGEREALWAGYEAAGGGRVDPDRALFWEVFGSLRWGVMCCGMPAAFRTVDPSVERAVIARRTSETEVDLLRLLAL